MSLLRRIFRGRPFEEERARGDTLFETGDFGQAKLAYERAEAKAPDDETRRALRRRIDESLDRIASARVELARQYLHDGDLDLAQVELRGALDTAVSEALRREAQQLVDGLERADAVQAAEEVEITDEDRLAAIAGTWVDEQDAEYAEQGDAVTDAVLALHAERFEEARSAFEELVDAAEAPRYLWFELGRARIHCGDDDRGAEALDTFLQLMGPDEGGEARLGAHMLLAKLADEAGDVDGAVAEFERAAEALEDDPRPLLELGRYLRARERSSEAVEVLELAVDGSEGEPGWQLLQELGLSYADAGEDDKAVATLESVITFMAARQHYDFPVLTALRLAQLHEGAGRESRAADMYRALSKGSDHASHFLYHFEAGRLLAKLGADSEALRMSKRAEALAEEREAALEAHDAESAEEREAVAAAREALRETRTKIAALVAQLGGEPAPRRQGEPEADSPTEEPATGSGPEAPPGSSQPP